MSFESRLRRIRENRGLKNEDVAEDVIDAEDEPEQTLEEELSDIGINLDDADNDDADTP